MKNKLTNILLTLLFATALLLSFAPDAHNHEPDGQEHTDCPVYVFHFVLFSVFTFVALIIIPLLQALEILPLLRIHRHVYSAPTNIIQRGPPSCC
jgi:hypothetical protein